MDCVIHQSPGRLRVRLAAFKVGEPDKLAALMCAIYGLDGVEYVKHNPVTGSLLVHYNACVLLPSSLINLLRSHGFLRGVLGFPRRVPHKPTFQPDGASSFRLSPETQKVLWAAGKILVGIFIERALDKKTRTLLSASLRVGKSLF